MACESVKQRGVSITLACSAFGISQSCYRHAGSASSENQKIADWLLRLTDNHRTWGFGLCFLYLRFRQALWLESQAYLPRLSPVGA
jgi:putative transposase